MYYHKKTIRKNDLNRSSTNKRNIKYLLIEQQFRRFLNTKSAITVQCVDSIEESSKGIIFHFFEIEW